MWSTTSGPRRLVGDERRLLLGVIGVMVDHLVDELRNDASQIVYGIDWFDQWDPEQRLWLLEQIVHALFGPGEPPESAAILDSTVDAIFCELDELIEWEIRESSQAVTRSWRDATLGAWAAQTNRRPELVASSDDGARWKITTTQISSALLGVRVYQQAESLRDVEPQRLAKFLRDKGLPSDYLERAPPVIRIDRAQLAIDRIQKEVFAK